MSSLLIKARVILLLCPIRLELILLPFQEFLLPRSDWKPIGSEVINLLIKLSDIQGDNVFIGDGFGPVKSAEYRLQVEIPKAI